VTSLSSQPRGSATSTSRVPIGPPPSSTGTLNAERMWTSTHGGKASGKGGDSKQGGTTAQKKGAGRKGGKAAAKK
jgi:hypothetical protein